MPAELFDILGKVSPRRIELARRATIFTMPCNGCQERAAQQRTERQRLDAKVMATVSEAITATRATHPELSARLMALNGEINAAVVKDKMEATTAEN